VLATDPSAAAPAPLPNSGGSPAAPPTPGQLRGTLVGAGNATSLFLRTVQPEGKRPMDAEAWLHGVRPEPDDRLGA